MFFIKKSVKVKIKLFKKKKAFVVFIVYIFQDEKIKLFIEQ